MGRKSILAKYLGVKCGGIEILAKDGEIDGRTAVKCKCLLCKKEFRQTFHNVYKGHYKSCGCIQYVSRSENSKWKGVGDLSASHFGSIQRGAKSRNLEFQISIDYIWNLYLLQNKKCAYSGVDLVFQKNRKDTNATASLDRINPKLGYVEGNVHWVHKEINYMKQDLSEEKFLKFIKQIYENKNQ